MHIFIEEERLRWVASVGEVRILFALRIIPKEEVEDLWMKAWEERVLDDSKRDWRA